MKTNTKYLNQTVYLSSDIHKWSFSNRSFFEHNMKEERNFITKSFDKTSSYRLNNIVSVKDISSIVRPSFKCDHASSSVMTTVMQ